MDKYVKNGKVAILISPGYGSSWSFYEDPALAYDKRIVEYFLTKPTEKEMQKYLEEIGYGHIWMGGYHQLKIVWVPQETKYRIVEYDGSESLQTPDDLNWEIA